MGPLDRERVSGCFTRPSQEAAQGTELGLRPLVAHCHFGLAKLSRQSNRREQAKEHFTIAITMYRDMGMQFWLEQAEVEMKGLA
jgi:hypothetical protein